MVGSAEMSHPYDCCVYLVDAGELVLIDAGAGKSFVQLVDNIAALGFDPATLSTVIVTHAHIDHIGALSEFKQRYGVKVIAHCLDADAIETGINVGAEFYGVDYAPCLVDIKLELAEDSINLSESRLKVVHIPGHTQGSIALYVDIDDQRVLFGQDIHGPYDIIWGGNPGQALISLQKLIDLRADILCEGHYGIYQPAIEVEEYIRGYLIQLRAATEAC